VAQFEYRPVPLYLSTAWEIRSNEHLAPVVAELLAPPPPKLAWQDACLRDELALDGAAERLAAVVRAAIGRRDAPPSAKPPATACGGFGRLDFRQIHSELSLFSAAPEATLAYELDAAHRLLRQAREQRLAAVRETSDLVEAAFAREIGGLRACKLIDHLAEAKTVRERHGSVSAGTATLDGHTSRTLFFGAPAIASWFLPTGKSGILCLALATHPDTWTNAETGPCRFLAKVDGKVLIDVTLDPLVRSEQRCWHWHNLPIPALPDEHTQFHQLNLEVQGVGGEAYRWALWRNPLMIWAADPGAAPDASSLLGALLPDYYQPGRTVR
jgi:hypothetical protein